MVGRPAVLLRGRRFHADTRFAKFNTYLMQMLPNVESVETPDAATFVVHTEGAAGGAGAFDKEVFPLMPKHIYDGTDIPTNPANRKPVGLGPFKLQTGNRAAR